MDFEENRKRHAEKIGITEFKIVGEPVLTVNIDKTFPNLRGNPSAVSYCEEKMGLGFVFEAFSKRGPDYAMRRVKKLGLSSVFTMFSRRSEIESHFDIWGRSK